MSDRTPGSVRTGARDGGSTAAGSAPGAAKDGSPSVDSTQAIPTTGSLRAQGAETAPAAGSPATVPPGPVPPGPLAQPAPVQAAAAQAAPAPTVIAPPSAGTTAARTSPATGQPDAGAARPAGRPARGKSGKPGRGPRRAKLQLRHVDIWSAFKISLVLSIALFFIWMVAIGILYLVLNALGVFSTLNDLFGQLGSASGGKATTDVIGAGVVFGGAAVIGAINVILMTALGTVATFIYNMCADLVGGLEVTLSERD
jgi:Transmembrane domain of unknown function (DUF3566)